MDQHDSDDDFVSDKKSSKGKSQESDENLANFNFPSGHCFVNKRWKGSQLAKDLDKVLKVHYHGGLGPVDWLPSPGIFIIYMGEADCVAGGLNWVQAKFRRLSIILGGQHTSKVFLIFQKTIISQGYQSQVQEMVCQSPNCHLVPVSGLEQVPQFLAQMVAAERSTNPFLNLLASKKRERGDRTDKDLLFLASKLPGLGEISARKLLSKDSTSSLKGIARARKAELSQSLGPKQAIGVENFFQRSNKI